MQLLAGLMARTCACHGQKPHPVLAFCFELTLKFLAEYIARICCQTMLPALTVSEGNPEEKRDNVF